MEPTAESLHAGCSRLSAAAHLNRLTRPIKATNCFTVFHSFTVFPCSPCNQSRVRGKQPKGAFIEKSTLASCHAYDT
jgi:hypothetical protein